MSQIDVHEPHEHSARVLELVAEPETMPRAPSPVRRRLITADALVLLVAWAAAVGALVAQGAAVPLGIHLVGPAVLVATGLMGLAVLGCYQRRVCAVRSREVARSLVVATASAIPVFAVLFGTVETNVALAAALTAAGTVGLALIAVRGLFREWIRGRRAEGELAAPVVVAAGTERAAERAAGFLRDHPHLGFAVCGTITTVPAVGDEHGIETVVAAVEAARATGVMLDAGSLTGDQLSDAVRALTERGVHVHVGSGLRGVDRRRITVAPLVDETFLHVAPLRLTTGQQRCKRAVDVVLASLLLVVSAPVLAISALAVAIGSKGPILYRQERVGRGGVTFTILKLRTMTVDAHDQVTELREDNWRDGPLLKIPSDPRVTRVGRMLRATSLDELPQLFNVLGGSMSLVGPRPALPEEVAEFDAALRARLNVLPGLTGLWQVEARDLTSFELYRRYDLLYVQNWSVLGDLGILAQTASVVLSRGVRSMLPGRGDGRSLLD